MNKPVVHVFPDPPQVAGAFAKYMQGLINSYRGRINIALSGGSTPKLLFEKLAAEYRTDIDWPKVNFYWGDERCVSPGHDESNFKMARELLLDHISIPQANVHRIHGEENPEHEALRYTQHLRNNIQNHQELPQFDLIMLGMGDDGHTASIFPDQMNLLEAPRSCAVATHPKTGQKRITLTGRVINNALNVAFLVTGEGKREKFESIHENHPDASAFPAFHIRPLGNLYWYVDQAAAGEEGSN